MNFKTISMTFTVILMPFLLSGLKNCYLVVGERTIRHVSRWRTMEKRKKIEEKFINQNENFLEKKRHKSLLLLFVRQYILNFPIAASTYIRIRNIHRQIDRSKEIFNFQVVAVRGRFLSLTQLDRKLQKTRMAQHQKPSGGRGTLE
jgi:hypothetical protein